MIRFRVVNTFVFDVIIGNPSLSVLKLEIQKNDIFTFENRVLGQYTITEHNQIESCNKIDGELNFKHLDNYFEKLSQDKIDFFLTK